jgi:hypothetical protein
LKKLAVVHVLALLAGTWGLKKLHVVVVHVLAQLERGA